MKVHELMNSIELLDEYAEALVEFNGTYYPITRVEDDSQGAYIVVDVMANQREAW